MSNISKFDGSIDLVCFSHLRWDFVFQRPQHLMTRFARARNVYYIQEPIQGAEREGPGIEIALASEKIFVVKPIITDPVESQAGIDQQREAVERLFRERNIQQFVAWYYTPMALLFSEHLKPLATVYDCMDELSAFRGAPALLPMLEKVLFERADVVFTGGNSLYELKRARHPNLISLPSSVDRRHFAQARDRSIEAPDQRSIAGPKAGFHGVIDERMDVDLLRELALRRQDWNFILIGPIVKIDPRELPRMTNIHYLGSRTYEDLPKYLAGWDAALLPFAINEATRFISPTKTLEYLAALKPTISTPISDVVSPYGEMRLVRIAREVEHFSRALDDVGEHSPNSEWSAQADHFLNNVSWDRVWKTMDALIARSIKGSAVVGL